MMGALFAFGADTSNILTAGQASIVAGMRITFSVAAILIFVALVIAAASHALARRATHRTPDAENAHASI